MPLGKFLETWFFKINFHQLICFRGVGWWGKPTELLIQSFWMSWENVFKVKATQEKQLLCTFYFYLISLLPKCYQRFLSALSPHYLFWKSRLFTFWPLHFFHSYLQYSTFHSIFIHIAWFTYLLLLFVDSILCLCLCLFVQCNQTCPSWPRCSQMIIAKKVSHSLEQQGHLLDCSVLLFALLSTYHLHPTGF